MPATWLAWMIAAGVGLLLSVGVAGAVAAAGSPPAPHEAAASAQPDSPLLAGCSVLPADNVWNTPIDALPVHPSTEQYVKSIGVEKWLHADFGSGVWEGGPIGIPYNVVSSAQSKVLVRFQYEDESDLGPYPIPAQPLIEGGPSGRGDRHILILEQEICRLYELFHAFPEPDGTWRAGSGAIFNLRSNALRPAGWTSADAAGLPILPGLVRYEEVAAGAIHHAVRFTAPRTQRAQVWPARHFASPHADPTLPPMGVRFRLKAGFDISRFPHAVQVILTALKTYGMILADNGASWFITGVPDERWDNDTLRLLHQIRGSDFEAVDTSSLMVDPNSGQARL